MLAALDGRELPRGRGPRAPRPDRGLAGRRVPRRAPGPAHRRDANAGSGRRLRAGHRHRRLPRRRAPRPPSSPRVRAFLLPHGDPRSHVGRPVRRRRRGQGLGPDPPRPGLDQPAGGAAGHGGRLVPLPHAAARAPPREARARPRRRRRRAHRRAAAWFAASGMPELAVDHLFAAGDPDAAAAQACAVVPRLFREGREATFARWLSRLDDDGLRRQPFLAVLGAWMHTILGRPADAERHGRPVPHRGIRRRSPAGRRALRGSPGLGAGAHGPRRAGRRGRTMRETPSPRAPRSARGDRSRWRCWARS